MCPQRFDRRRGARLRLQDFASRALTNPLGFELPAQLGEQLVHAAIEHLLIQAKVLAISATVRPSRYRIVNTRRSCAGSAAMARRRAAWTCRSRSTASSSMSAWSGPGDGAASSARAASLTKRRPGRCGSRPTIASNSPRDRAARWVMVTISYASSCVWPSRVVNRSMSTASAPSAQGLRRGTPGAPGRTLVIDVETLDDDGQKGIDGASPGELPQDRGVVLEQLQPDVRFELVGVVLGEMVAAADERDGASHGRQVSREQIRGIMRRAGGGEARPTASGVRTRNRDKWHCRAQGANLRWGTFLEAETEHRLSLRWVFSQR